MVIPQNKPPRCPKCGSDDVVFIIYGPVEMTEEILAAISAKKIVLRQAEQSSPNKYYCRHCGYEW